MYILYDVLLNDRPVGSVSVKEEGLYICFDCVCSLPDAQIYKLVAQCANGTVEIGVCVPLGESFGISRKIPHKHLGDGAMRFFVIPNRKDSGESAVYIDPQKPCSCLHMLYNARLKVCECGYYIVLNNESLMD